MNTDSFQRTVQEQCDEHQRAKYWDNLDKVLERFDSADHINKGAFDR